MGLVKVVVQFKNDIADVKPEHYISLVQVGKPCIRHISIPPSHPADSALVCACSQSGWRYGI